MLGLAVSSIINAAAAGGWHAAFEGANEVVVGDHGFVVATVFGLNLRVEAGFRHLKSSHVAPRLRRYVGHQLLDGTTQQ